jgi:hypothetical protein
MAYSVTIAIGAVLGTATYCNNLRKPAPKARLASTILLNCMGKPLPARPADSSNSSQKLLTETRIVRVLYFSSSGGVCRAGLKSLQSLPSGVPPGMFCRPKEPFGTLESSSRQSDLQFY